MDYSEFTGEVQHRIDVGTQAQAVKTTRAVLSSLGERVQTDEAADLAGPLPMEIDRFLTEADSGQRFGYDEFVNRVADRADVEESEAAYRAKAVTALVADLDPAGEIEDVEDGLPDEFQDLFEFTSLDEDETPW
ncbi:DUF2267 domain-containing protein [Halobaculum sp. D14]|uniref:DUF2267 domain-containing protein n=1 Tax=unclassified Halobaculum TaxID=2640896 RepID=UPI003EBA7853